MTEPYDAVVVGAGLGGLSAAAYLSHYGRRVLLIDRQDGVGGYGHRFQRGPYTFDPAIHILPSGAAGDPLDRFLSFLGVREQCQLLPFHDFYRTVFPGLRLTVPFGYDAMGEAHAAAFPSEAEGIRRFFETCGRFAREARQVPIQLAIKDLDQQAERFPTYFRHRPATVASVLSESVRDPRAQAACTAFWPYVGLPPSRLSFEIVARLLLVFERGACHPVGGAQTLADALLSAHQAKGGEVILGGAVRSIDFVDGRAGGVTLEDGRSFRARHVISNADALQTFRTLLGMDHVPESYARRLAKLKPSLSAFVLYAATSLDLRQLDLGHEMFLFRRWDHEETHADILAGNPGGMWIAIPTLADPTLAPPGEHLVILSSLAAYDIGKPWPEEKPRFTDALLAELERLIPGVRGALTFVETATPLTMERYTAGTRGAIYGWENSVAQAGSKRLSYVTPVPGLYLAGHWSQPCGSWRVMISGTHVAKIILSGEGERDVGPDF